MESEPIKKPQKIKQCYFPALELLIVDNCEVISRDALMGCATPLNSADIPISDYDLFKSIQNHLSDQHFSFIVDI